MPVRKIVPAAAFILLSSGASAQPGPDWSHAQRVDVTLSNFAFSPKSIHLRAGRPVVLHLANTSSGGHDFTAKQFFATSAVRPQDRGSVRGGSVEVGKHRSVDVALVPRAGRYPLKCGHTFHKTFGMSGEIVVD